MNFRSLLWAVSSALVALSPSVHAQTPIFSKSTGDTDWSSYLLDTASGSTSAAGMLGVSGDSVSTVSNVRDLVTALQGLGSSDTALALSITPARTSFLPMSLPTYAHSPFARLLGSLTFGYAQGDTSISGSDFSRRAVSVETSLIFDAKHEDPVVAYAEAVKAGEGDCAILRSSQPDGTGDSSPDPAPPAAVGSGPAVPHVVSDAEAQEVQKRAAACRDTVLKAVRWNRSQISVSYATGWIRAKSDGEQHTLGKALTIGLTYGFDQIPALRKILAAQVTFQRTLDEPVLDSLTTGPVNFRDTSLAVLHLSGGTDNVRGLAEVSNTQSHDVTGSQRAFKRALGLDIHIHSVTWINIRVGQQEKIGGNGQEVGTLVSLSYSPTALLK